LTRRDLERRLAKAEVAVSTTTWADRQAADYRRLLRTRVKTHDLIRERLLEMGIDPTLAMALRRGEEAAAELAGIPDTLQLQIADEAIIRTNHSSGTDGAGRVQAKILSMAERYGDGRRPDFANASMLELFAFVLAADSKGEAVQED
jgi:hypothetical protein